MYLSQYELQTLYQDIVAYNKIIIHRHVRPDPDALGSQLGLKSLIQNAFPDKEVLAAGTTSAGLAWMGDMDRVTAEDYQNALVIVTDTANRPRIDGDHYDLGERLIKIDHHPPVDNYGDLAIVYPEASSTSELIASISLALGNQLPMTNEVASLLYAGIVGDTGRFKYDSTSSTTFAVASELAKYEVDMFAINDRFSLISPSQARFQGHALESIQISESGLASLTITRQDLEHFQISEEETNSVVGLLGQIQGVVVWVIFIEQVGNSAAYRARIRSKGPAINGVAEKYHGGGHAKASGAKAFNQQEIGQMLDDLDALAGSWLEEL